MDTSDAVNIMVHSTPSDGVALWHIFAAVDSNSIRKFLHKQFQGIKGDPIHSQLFYLGPNLLAQLDREYKVKPYTIEQKVDHAVFIPAGCAHQVRISSYTF